MNAFTIKEAKARLNELIEAAERGEQVVLMRGSKHVATIVPITDADIELAPRLTDAQAARFWEQLARDRRAGQVREFSSASQAVTYLAMQPASKSHAAADLRAAEPAPTYEIPPDSHSARASRSAPAESARPGKKPKSSARSRGAKKKA